MRKFHPESTSNPTFATQENWELSNGRAMTESQKTAFFQAAHYLAARSYGRTLNPPLGFNKVMDAMEREFGAVANAVYRQLSQNLQNAHDAARP